MLNPVLLEKLNAAVEPGPVESRTRRDLRLPAVPGKAHAVVGMRRTGKTTFLRELRDERRRHVPPERAIFLGFDDDRLSEANATQLAWLLEEYYRRFPELREQEVVYWFLDEIQVVSGWERFVRRILDTERVEVVVSGSSARMLSREVHTSLRGRGMETVVRPFSFREYLRHRGEEPERPAGRWTAPERSRIERRFREYLMEGGFPEAQGLGPSVRVELLQGYVDTVLFRDLVERYGITQVAALRWVTRHCLRNPARPMSVHRLYGDLRAQGHAVSKDTVHALLGHLQDAFLLATVPIATESERRKNSNPRRVFPADPGLIGAFDASGKSNIGHRLETTVFIELLRRKAEVGYVRTPEGFEVDFLARYATAGEELIQVCADPGEPEVLAREVRALSDAARDCPRATRRLLVLDRDHVPEELPPGILAQPAYQWLLDSDTASEGAR